MKGKQYFSFFLFFFFEFIRLCNFSALDIVFIEENVFLYVEKTILHVVDASSMKGFDVKASCELSTGAKYNDINYLPCESGDCNVFVKWIPQLNLVVYAESKVLSHHSLSNFFILFLG